MFLDTDSDGNEKGVGHNVTPDMVNSGPIASTNIYNDPNNSSNFDANGKSHTNAQLVGNSGDVTFTYTPYDTVSGDTQTGKLSVTIPSTNGNVTLYHDIQYSAANPGYYFGVAASTGFYSAAQYINYKNVDYTPIQNATVKIVDADNNNQELYSQTFTGKIGGVIDPDDTISQKLQNFEANNYTVANNFFADSINYSATADIDGSGNEFNMNLKGNQFNLDGTTPYSDNKVHFNTDLSTLNPVYTITLKHALSAKLQTTVQNKTRTINYLDANTGQPITNVVPKTQSIAANYSRYQIVDKINGEIRGYSNDGTTNVSTPANAADSAWKTSASFASVPSPDLTGRGYAALSQADASVPASTVTYNTNPVENIYYQHAYANVSAIDNKTVGGAINADANSTATWPSGVSADQLSHTVSRQISYVDATTGQSIHMAEQPQVAHFNRTAIVDKVTGNIVGYVNPNGSNNNIAADQGDTAWKSSDSQFTGVTVPTITNYVTPQNVSALTVQYNSGMQDANDTNRVIQVVVPYTQGIRSINPDNVPANVDPQTLKRTFTRNVVDFDLTTGQPIKTSPTVQTITLTRTGTYNEVTGAVSDYTPWTVNGNTGEGTQTADDLTGLGYQAHPDHVAAWVPTTDAITAGNLDTTALQVDYQHSLVNVSANDNKQVNGAINSDANSSAKWPSSASADQLNRSVTRTTRYIDKTTGQDISGVQPTQNTVQFTRDAVVDKVTGALLGYANDNN